MGSETQQKTQQSEKQQYDTVLAFSMGSGKQSVIQPQMQLQDPFVGYMQSSLQTPSFSQIQSPAQVQSPTQFTWQDKVITPVTKPITIYDPIPTIKPPGPKQIVEYPTVPPLPLTGMGSIGSLQLGNWGGTRGTQKKNYMNPVHDIASLSSMFAKESPQRGRKKGSSLPVRLLTGQLRSAAKSHKKGKK